MTRVLVTGASGFIGRHCLPLLRTKGFELHATARHKPADAPADVAWHTCDLLEAGASRQLIRTVQPTHILHLAWIATPGVFWSSAENHAWRTATVSLFREFSDHRGRRFVGVGSCAEYSPVMHPCREDDATQPTTLYGQCKLAAYRDLADEASARRVSMAWARIFYPYGVGENAGKLIPSAIGALASGRPFNCTEGRQKRDFVFVDDVANMLAMLLESGAEGPFNAGTGQATAVRDVVSLIAERVGAPHLIRFGAIPERQGEPAILVADTTRTAAQLRWSARIDLPTGIDRTIAAWYDARGRIGRVDEEV